MCFSRFLIVQIVPKKRKALQLLDELIFELLNQHVSAIGYDKCDKQWRFLKIESMKHLSI